MALGLPAPPVAVVRLWLRQRFLDQHLARVASVGKDHVGELPTVASAAAGPIYPIAAGHQLAQPLADLKAEPLLRSAFRLADLGRVNVQGTPLQTALPAGVAVHDAGQLAPAQSPPSKPG